MFSVKRKSEIFEYQSNNSININNILTKLDQNSDFYMSDKERYKKQAIKNRRKSFSNQNQGFFINRKKINEQKRKTTIYNEFENILKVDNEKYKNKIKSRNEKGLNCELMGFNPITLKYFKNKKGKFLEKTDRINNIRKVIRSKNLEYQTSMNFDLISGKPRNLVKVSNDILDKYKDKFTIPKRKVRVYKYDFHF